jgi:hypothetical protein
MRIEIFFLSAMRIEIFLFMKIASGVFWLFYGAADGLASFDRESGSHCTRL